MTQISNPTNLPEPQIPQQPKKSHKLLIIILILIILLLCCGITILGGYASMLTLSLGGETSMSEDGYETTSGDSASNNKILTISINGTILNEGSESSSIFDSSTYVYGYEIKQQLINAADDSSIKAVMLEINSPGGTITGSKAISDGVAYYKQKTSNPVYAHIMGTGASGAYWSAASADKIYSDYGSLVGSIGVIYGPFKYYNKVTSEISGLEGVATEGGIETYYITSGYYKDFGNSYREMTDEEKADLQADTDAAYDDFVNFVSSSRKIPADTIKNKIKALPYGEKQALQLGLIDGIAARGDAYDALAKAANIATDYQVIRVKTEQSFWSLLLSGKLLTNNTVNSGKSDAASELKGQMLYYYGYPE